MKAAILTTICLLAIAAPARAQDDTQVYKPGNGVAAPKLLKDVKPTYPADALRTGITGAVRMECVVLADGTVGDVQIVESLYPSIDEEAINALKQWSFSPGTKDGKAVPVRVEVEMTFTTRGGPRLGSADVFLPGPDTTSPRLVHETKPAYTAEAQAARIQGNIMLECVVLDDGTVGDVRVTKKLDTGLDAEAIRTLRQWRFTPGQRDGRPVPVQVSVEMTFTLR